MPRSVPEWQGKTDDAPIPQRVKLRVLERQRNEDSIPICPDCGQPIRPGQAIHFDHGTPLADGGTHSEGNLRAIHERPCHVIKTAREAQTRAVNRSQVKHHYGLKPDRPSFATNRNGRWKKKLNGELVPRRSQGEPS